MMKRLARPRALESQSVIDDWDDYQTKSPYHAKPIIGEFYEEMALALFGGERLRTEAFAFCPDIRLNGRFIECKALKDKGNAFLLDSSIQEYEKLPEEMIFAFWIHKPLLTTGIHKSELRKALAQNTTEVLVIDYDNIKQIIEKQKRELTSDGRLIIRIHHRRLSKLKYYAESYVNWLTVDNTEIRPFIIRFLSKMAEEMLVVKQQS